MIRGRSKRRGFTLIEVLVVVIIIGILGNISIQNFRKAQDKSRNSSQTANMRSIGVALENYSSEHQGHYPTPGQELTLNGLLQNSYLPGNRLPKTPWGPYNQANTLNQPTIIAVTTTPALYDAATFAGNPGNQLPVCPLLEAGGPGKAPLSNNMDEYTYGAFLYDVDPNTGTYVIYGIGKRDNKAIVNADRTNAGN